MNRFYRYTVNLGLIVRQTVAKTLKNTGIIILYSWKPYLIPIIRFQDKQTKPLIPHREKLKFYSSPVLGNL